MRRVKFPVTLKKSGHTGEFKVSYSVFMHITDSDVFICINVSIDLSIVRQDLSVISNQVL